MTTITPQIPVTFLPQGRIFKAPVQQLEILFAAVGPKLLKEELHTPWLSLTQVSRACQKYKIKWPGGNHKASTLERLAEEYFEKITNVMKVADIKVEYKTEWVEKGRRYRPFFKFHQLDPANDCPLKEQYDI